MSSPRNGGHQRTQGNTTHNTTDKPLHSTRIGPWPAAAGAACSCTAMWCETTRLYFSHVPITNRHDSSWFGSFRSHFALFWSFWLAISEPEWTSPQKSHLKSGLNQRDRAKSAASPIRSFVKTTQISVAGAVKWLAKKSKIVTWYDEPWRFVTNLRYRGLAPCDPRHSSGL